MSRSGGRHDEAGDGASTARPIVRVLHIVPLASDDGSFGGPLRVALNQVGELRRRGHEATLVAGTSRRVRVNTVVDGVPVQLFPTRRLVRRGFAGLVSPAMIRWLWASVRHFDVVHVHAGRDLVSLAALQVASFRRMPFLTQTHGMIMPDARRAVRIVDALAARRLLRRAGARLVLTDEEERGLYRLLSGSATSRLVNGIKGHDRLAEPTRGDVLFLARLHPRKRPELFVEAAAALHARFPALRWSIVGPDEGQLGAVLRRVEELDATGYVRYEGTLSYDEVADRMRRAEIYVLPSVDEPFPMSLVEALALGVPSVCTDSCGLAPLLRSRGAASVVGPSLDDLVAGVEELAADPGLRSLRARRAVDLVDRELSIGAVADELERTYTVLRAAGG